MNTILQLTLLLLFTGARLCMTATIDQLIARANNERVMDHVANQNNIKRVEMDILFTNEDWYTIQGLMGMSQRKKRKALKFESRRWPQKTVPYEIEPGFTATQLGEVKKAIDEWETYSCVQLKKRTTESDYVYMKNGGGCASYIGRIGGRQDIWLAPGCRYKGVVVHELGHAIGYFHEQSRPDRDNHVTILTQNIRSGLEGNFNKYSTSIINTYNVQYDYTSVMHYGSHYFSKNGQPTIQTKDPSKQKLIGNRSGLSFRDLQLANKMYACSELCNPVPNCPADSYVGKDCKCWCPGNPAKLCSSSPGPTDPPTQKPTERTESPTTSQTQKPTQEPTQPSTVSPTASPTNPPGTILKSGDFCFAAFEERKTKYEAELSCNQWHHNGHLAWFSSEDEWSELATAIAAKKKPRYWYTGLMKTDFGWTSDEDMTFVNFHFNEPNKAGEGCGFLNVRRDWKWIDADCSRKEISVCKAPCTGGCTGCTFTYNGACYFVDKKKRMFFEAEMNCAAKFDGGHLLWIESQAENDYMMKQLQTHAGNYYYIYIGLVIEQKWSYTSGYNVTFTKWGEKQPSRAHEICTVLDRNLRNPKYGFADVKCERKESYICKARCTQTESEKCDQLTGTGPFPDSCIRQWMLDAGCSLDGTLLTTDITDITGLTVSEVKVVILSTRRDALSDPAAGTKCYGSQNVPTSGKCDITSNGPHPLVCLTKWWVESGCSAKGRHSPTRAPEAQIQNWNGKQASQVLYDMYLYRKLAFEGRANYPEMCHGEKLKVDCDVRFKKGPHPHSCLVQWWYKAGCSGHGTGSPVNRNDTSKWDNMQAEAVQQDMVLIQKEAMSSSFDKDGESFVSKCYGGTSMAVCACDSYPSDAQVPKLCQIKFWKDAGCSLKGTKSPHRLHDTHSWTQKSLEDVKQLIIDLRDKAFQGDHLAAEECFGDTFKAGESCNNERVRGPHKLTCLMKWWQAVGCKANAGASPTSEYGIQLFKAMSSKYAYQIRKQVIKNIKTNAFQNNSVNGLTYVYLCYGV